MSGMGVAKQKLKEGIDWRGTINADIGGDSVSLTVRQLRDPELEEVMDKISREELQNLRDAYPSETMDELDELREADELDDDEHARMQELEAEMEAVDVDLFDILSTATFEGIRLAAIYGVEPDDDDKKAAVRDRAREIEREYGVRVSGPEDVEEPLNEEWEEYIRNATGFVSFQIGMKVLTETVGEEGN